MGISYNMGNNEYKNWMIAENNFDLLYMGKIESIFCLANGYMGLRSATEEAYVGEIRGCYVAGVFDLFPGEKASFEVTELANIPDFVNVEIEIDGETFNLREGVIHSYCRKLNMKDGELTREVEWESPKGKNSKLLFKRFVSLDQIHIAGISIEIKPLNYSGSIKILSGINGQVTNSGSQHFRSGDVRIFSDGLMYMSGRTQESNITVVVAAKNSFYSDGKNIETEEKIKCERRQMFLQSVHKVEKNQIFVVEKIAAVYSSRDPEFKDSKEITKNVLVQKSIDELKKAYNSGYSLLFKTHKNKWNSLWEKMDIKIEGPDYDQIGLRFAQFHLYQTAPTHDERLSIGAKALSGEGYKGHVFWDTEIFALPFFIYTFPAIAKKLLTYRYHTLDGARRKAKENNYKGAMFAWESALTGDETTPKSGGIDYKTGKPLNILTGDIEQHITADVSHAIWHYYESTHDEEFMQKYGGEILLETARFWASRLEKNKEKDYYEITNVIGPDEHSEHVDNNAYTNCMAQWNIRIGVVIADIFKKKYPSVWEKLSAKIDVTDEEMSEWLSKADKIYIPFESSTGFIHQYEGFKNKKEIDLTKYRDKTGSVFQDYSFEEINKLQVIKQADVLMLLYLKGDLFDESVKKINWDYYEPKTVHDSSLSQSMHSIIASDMNEPALAYQYFCRSLNIDLGDKVEGSKDGVHAAAIGGNWQAVFNGFSGIRIVKGGLHINPRLPEKWNRISLQMTLQGCDYQLEISKKEIKIKSLSKEAKIIPITVFEKVNDLKPLSELRIEY